MYILYNYMLFLFHYVSVRHSIMCMYDVSHFGQKKAKFIEHTKNENAISQYPEGFISHVNELDVPYWID